MPNHISNKLTLHCNAVTAAKVFVEIGRPADEDGEFLIDFNKLIPYPERYANADRERREWEKANPGKSCDKAPQDGYNHGGYEWCRDNWGTKWNAYAQQRVNDKAIFFHTAWSTPEPIFNALSARFPDLPFTIEYADEDKGRNAGILQYRNGKKGEASVDGTGAVRLWFKLNPDHDPKEYGYNPKTFEYVGEEDEVA